LLTVFVDKGKLLSTVVGAEVDLDGPVVTGTIGKFQSHPVARLHGLHRGEEGLTGSYPLIIDVGY
jgi:hypothetical protein